MYRENFATLQLAYEDKCRKADQDQVNRFGFFYNSLHYIVFKRPDGSWTSPIQLDVY